MPAKCIAEDQDIFAMSRGNMVREQLVVRENIVDEAVLQAMSTVPRHRFVPQPLREYAYEDHPLPIGSNQTISQPYIVAAMTQAVQLQRKDRVLEIGTGSGYQTAVLAEIVDVVHTIEIVPKLALGSARILAELGYKNICARQGDGSLGWPEVAPFDAIIVTAAPDHVPPVLTAQLSSDGGRLILPVGAQRQELELWRRVGFEMKREVLLPVRFVPMTGEVGRER